MKTSPAAGPAVLRREPWRARVARAVLDAVFPRVCAVCGARDPGDGGHVCWDCLRAVRFLQAPFCSCCGDPVAGRVDGAFRCAACVRGRVWFDAARSAARYAPPLSDLIRLFKYRRGLWVADDLAGLLEAALRAHFDPRAVDGVAFVPLSPPRRRERQYNQAEILARALCRRTGLPLLPRGLARIRPTPTQTHLTAPQRAANVRNAFQAVAPAWIEGRRILLIDDVMTTGATVNECSRVLRRAGAARIWALTVARG